MPRPITVAAAQLGPIQRAESRAEVVQRLMALLTKAHRAGVKLVVFPELALTTFFPRWFMPEWNEVDAYFESEMPSPETKPLFDRAKEWGIGFYLGFAERFVEKGKVRRFNTAILVDDKGTIVGKYRKVHLPGYSEPDNRRPIQHLEKRYFEPGDIGFPVWRTMGGVMGMCICNDRRWPETYRVMGLKGVEMVLLGYNTPSINIAAAQPPHLRMFHNHLTMQAGAYQNSTYVIAAAKAGIEDGNPLIGGSCIVAPTGEIVAQAQTEADELIVADCDLDNCTFGKKTVFNFAQHRRIEHYKIITEQTGVVPAP